MIIRVIKDCRNSTLNYIELEMGFVITTMQQQSNLLGSRYDAPIGSHHRNRNNRFMHRGYHRIEVS